ncbi:MAG TPA: hypothetical protein VK726_25575 [Acetobacteraceae bacterium]|jgi:hypothetical protein|nr:hypothetical protein [Acetobacteraceae bacterium]
MARTQDQRSAQASPRTVLADADPSGPVIFPNTGKTECGIDLAGAIMSDRSAHA